jgi:hypothetical protein
VLKERNPERTDVLLEELLRALEERSERRGAGQEDAGKPS